MKSRLDYVTIKMEVIRVSFSFLIENELKQQKQQLYQSKQFLNRAPDGFLKMRERKVDAVFYRKYRTENGYLEENISKNPQIVRCLLGKSASRKKYYSAGRFAGELSKHRTKGYFAWLIAGLSKSILQIYGEETAGLGEC